MSIDAPYMPHELLNYVNGRWERSEAREHLGVTNPATAQTIAEVPQTPAADVDEAAQAAVRAFAGWRRTPVTERIQPLFRLKNLLEANLDDLARTITEECGKTYAESAGEVRRGIENVEVACGAPILMQGQTNEDIAQGID